MSPLDRHRQKKRWVQSKQTSTGPSRQTLAEKKRWEPVQTDTDQTHQTDTGKKDIGLVQIDIKWSLQTGISKRRWETLQADTDWTHQTNTGKKKHLGSVQIEINRSLQTDIGRKETVGTSSDRHRPNPSDRHWQEKILGRSRQTSSGPFSQISAKDVGKHFRQTPIEPIRQTLAKRNIWVQSR